MNCEHEGCNEQATEYELYAINEDGSSEKFWLCNEHAPQMGFCCMCGHFTAGADDHWLYSHGVCEDCFDQLRAENGEFDHEEDYDLY